MLDMGVEDYLMTSTVNAVLAQRLVRTLCPHCRRSYRPATDIVRRWRLGRLAEGGEITLYQAVGCEYCGNSGYVGRSAILELLVMSDRLRQMVLEHADAVTLAKTAAAEGMHTMFEDGLRKAVAGETSLEEVLRVTQDSHEADAATLKLIQPAEEEPAAADTEGAMALEGEVSPSTVETSSTAAVQSDDRPAGKHSSEPGSEPENTLRCRILAFLRRWRQLWFHFLELFRWGKKRDSS
jgi:hypothetical protein